MLLQRPYQFTCDLAAVGGGLESGSFCQFTISNGFETFFMQLFLKLITGSFKVSGTLAARLKVGLFVSELPGKLFFFIALACDQFFG